MVMSSEKLKQRKEREFYESIKTVLEFEFRSYVEESRYQNAPFPNEENLYLKITAFGHSETLTREFSDRALRFLSVEKNLPDIMGFVQKKSSKKKEFITVEVKRSPVRFLHILQAKLYQDIFDAKFGLLISTKGIRDDKVRFVLKTPLGRSIRGKVIIAKFKELPYGYGDRMLIARTLEINPKFKDSVPEPFKRLCK